MAEKFCYSLLQMTTLQLLQAAGFDSGNTSSVQTLTNIFERYLELLSSTALAYAQHNGKSSTSIYDLLEAFGELGIDIPSLTDWINEETRSLAPSWTEQADPSRTLKDTIHKGLEHQEDIIYEYGDLSDVPSETVITSSDDESSIEELSKEGEAEKDTLLGKVSDLPHYIPKYFPPFPALASNEDEEIQHAPGQPLQNNFFTHQKASIEQQQTALYSAPTKANDTLPLPNIVKRKVRPIENPFIHLKPFEDSLIASITTLMSADNDSVSASDMRKEQVEPLSLQLLTKTDGRDNVTKNLENEHLHDSNLTIPQSISNSAESISAALRKRRGAFEKLQQLIKRVKYDDATSKDNNYRSNHNIEESKSEKSKRFLLEGISFLEAEIRNEAAPGNTLFIKNNKGLLETLVTHATPPIAIPKLLAPNLLLDIHQPVSSGIGASSASGTKLRLNISNLRNTASGPTGGQGPGRKHSVGGFTIVESAKKQQQNRENSEFAPPPSVHSRTNASAEELSTNLEGEDEKEGSGSISDNIETGNKTVIEGKKGSISSKRRRSRNSNKDNGGLSAPERSKTAPISLAALAAGGSVGNTASESGKHQKQDKNTKRKLTISLPKAAAISTSANAKTDSAMTASPTSPILNKTISHQAPEANHVAPSSNDTTTASTNIIPKIRFRIKLPTPDTEQPKS
ncbi:hypothetical protein BDF20DRAFT_850926 [Mycotypha africana]|uniref:uncharacterized protein n=1 Tax=Mycotypha africana TaxID=64632 RepID=UPI00230002A1|nr:uncharacterized protein BDF20DRAFT_850926 [Mycotypha africana]KAI8987565.1 hypothetical protein BDF20DRAFT_850926 [Mycotypha africana]